MTIRFFGLYIINFFSTMMMSSLASQSVNSYYSLANLLINTVHNALLAVSKKPMEFLIAFCAHFLLICMFTEVRYAGFNTASIAYLQSYRLVHY